MEIRCRSFLTNRRLSSGSRETAMTNVPSPDPLEPRYRRVVLKLSGEGFSPSGKTGISIDAPSGKVTIDPPTHHCVLDVHIAEVKDKKLNVLEDFAQQKPADTAAVCDLIKNPTDNQQYVIKI